MISICKFDLSSTRSVVLLLTCIQFQYSFDYDCTNKIECFISEKINILLLKNRLAFWYFCNEKNVWWNWNQGILQVGVAPDEASLIVGGGQALKVPLGVVERRAHGWFTNLAEITKDIVSFVSTPAWSRTKFQVLFNFELKVSLVFCFR